MKMNNLYSIIAIAAILSLSFCKDNKDDPEPTPPPLTGGNPEAGITYEASGGGELPKRININEGGAAYEYTIVLNSQPSADVTISISLSNNAPNNLEVSSDLVFTNSNWNQSQTISLNLKEDNMMPGEQEVTLTHSFTSDDPDYNSIEDRTLIITATDNDTPGIQYAKDNSALPDTISLAEGDTDVEYEYTISLNTMPSGDVMIDISLPAEAPDNLQLDNGGAPIGAGKSIELIFTTMDWNSPQMVKLTLGADNIASGNASVTITHSSTSADPDYDSISRDLVVTTTDDEMPTVTIPATVMINEGDNGDISISISHQPAEEVSITLMEDSEEASISPNILTFAPDDWAAKMAAITITDNDVLTTNRNFNVSYTATVMNEMNPIS